MEGGFAKGCVGGKEGTPGDLSKNSTHALTTHPRSYRVFQNCHLTSFVFHKKVFPFKRRKNRLILSNSSSNSGSERMEASSLSFPPFFLQPRDLSILSLVFPNNIQQLSKNRRDSKTGAEGPFGLRNNNQTFVLSPPLSFTSEEREKSKENFEKL